MESISAVILGLILMLSLLVQLQTLVLNPWKLLATFRCYSTENARDVRSSKLNLVQHYPKLPELLNSNSESKMMICSPRSILSSPAVPRVASLSCCERLIRKAIPLAQHSSTFVATQIELPVVDITCNYNSCRYNTFEESLRTHYGVNYPPGEVVLNYIQLNTPDSRIGIKKNVSDNLLDPFEESDATYSSVSTKREAEYLNLLDHFISKQQGKALTASKCTEIPSSDDRNLEASSHAGTSSQSTLRSFVAQEKESGSSGNQRSSKAVLITLLSSAKKTVTTWDDGDADGRMFRHSQLRQNARNIGGWAPLSRECSYKAAAESPVLLLLLLPLKREQSVMALTFLEN
ncbi:hypothetical protein DMN91_002721 [Ooceraea biroi]|uniref:Uncharacterized protein n=1 Tax=Ooceraea biroi TaxID=2015173 RepID=A0A3L8DWD9_OOCBI|nr:hypothetical protein DMN91_002721 [Ooceraea biroi]